MMLWPSSALPDHAVVIVTGASSGIGEAVALGLARRGHDLVLVARRRGALESVAEGCSQAGASSVMVVPTDVSDDDAVAALFVEVMERHGVVDGVAHCAGEVTYGRTEKTSAAVFNRVIATNVSGSANIARHAIAQMRAQERGVLVLVGSLLGHVAIPEMTPYVVSKWGIRALARQLVVENVDLKHVHISHVAPGSVDTPIYERALESAGTVNTPPPPTISPERAARVVIGQLSRPNVAKQTTLSNYALILAFQLAPRLYDRMIGPVFKIASRMSSEPEPEPAPDELPGADAADSHPQDSRPRERHDVEI